VTIQPLHEAIGERVMQRIRYWNWWPLHPIQYHRSERFRRAVDMIYREFEDIAEEEGTIRIGADAAAEAGYVMILSFERSEE